MLRAHDVLTRPVVTCTPDDAISEVAATMARQHVGAIPVVDGSQSVPIGIITDRDIVTSAVAKDGGSRQETVRDHMASPAVCMPADATLADCAEAMGEHQVRRLPLVNRKGSCVGVIALADIARNAPPEVSAEALRRISQDDPDGSGTARTPQSA